MCVCVCAREIRFVNEVCLLKYGKMERHKRYTNKQTSYKQDSYDSHITNYTYKDVKLSMKLSDVMILEV